MDRILVMETMYNMEVRVLLLIMSMVFDWENKII